MVANTTQTRLDIASLQGILLVFFAGVLWSTVGLGIRLIEEASVWQILFFRSCSLSCFLLVVIYFRSGNPIKLIRVAGIPALVAGFSLVIAYAGGIYSIQETSVANAMLLFATAPFFTAVLGWIFLGERVTKVTSLAILVALIGISIMVADKLGEAEFGGSIAAIGSALGFAVFTVSLRWGKFVEMMPAVFLSGILGVLISAGICLSSNLSFDLTPNDLSIALCMGVFQVGAGLVLYTIGSKSLPATQLALLSLAEVLLGPLWVWLFLGEVISKQTVFGGFVLLSALVFNAILGQKSFETTVP